MIGKERFYLSSSQGAFNFPRCWSHPRTKTN